MYFKAVKSHIQYVVTDLTIFLTSYKRTYQFKIFEACLFLSQEGDAMIRAH